MSWTHHPVPEDRCPFEVTRVFDSPFVFVRGFKAGRGEVMFPIDWYSLFRDTAVWDDLADSARKAGCVRASLTIPTVTREYADSVAGVLLDEDYEVPDEAEHQDHLLWEWKEDNQ